MMTCCKNAAANLQIVEKRRFMEKGNDCMFIFIADFYRVGADSPVC